MHMQIEIIYTENQKQGKRLIGALIGHSFVPRKQGETAEDLRSRVLFEIEHIPSSRTEQSLRTRMEPIESPNRC
jgi:hypothetical protein